MCVVRVCTLHASPITNADVKVRARPFAMKFSTTWMPGYSPRLYIRKAQTAAVQPDAASSTRRLPPGLPEHRAETNFLNNMKKCSSIRDWNALVCDRDFRKSATELGAALYALVKLQNSQKTKSLGAATTKQVRRLKSIATKSLPEMPSRSIANVLFALACLRSLDKLLLAKVVRVVPRRINDNRAEFKLPELAQICFACTQLNFKNKALTDAIADGVMGARVEDYNPTSLSNLLHAFSLLNCGHKGAVGLMVSQLAGFSEAMSPDMFARTFKALAKLQAETDAVEIALLQTNMRRQKRNKFTFFQSLDILEALAQLQRLDQQTADFLLPVLTEADARLWRPHHIQQVARLISKMSQQGISGVVVAPDETMAKAVEWLRKQAGKGPVTAEMQEQARVVADMVCVRLEQLQAGSQLGGGFVSAAEVTVAVPNGGVADVNLLANIAHGLASLNAAGPELLKPMTSFVVRRLSEDIRAIKLQQLSKICFACMRVRFAEPEFLGSVTRAVAACPRSAINAPSLINILVCMAALRFAGASDTLLEKLVLVTDDIPSGQYARVFSSLADLKHPGTAPEVPQLQGALRGQPSDKLLVREALDCLNALLTMNALEKETADYLFKVLQATSASDWKASDKQALDAVRERMSAQGLGVAMQAPA